MSGPGALVLEQALGVFPPGTVHLAVVDPGVGGNRRPICVLALGMLFVGPDNGVFTPVFLADAKARARILADDAFFRKPVSQPFTAAMFSLRWRRAWPRAWSPPGLARK